MAQWLLKFRIDVKNVQDVYQSNARKDANAILKAVTRVQPRPIRAVYDDGDGRINLSFIVDADDLSRAHQAQWRIHDAIADSMKNAAEDLARYAIEFEHPSDDVAAVRN